MGYVDSSSSYVYSYSGTDARAFAYFEGRGDLITPIKSLHTISWSVNEAKGQARAFGYRGIKGFGRGIRTIAGSLILTVIEDNPLAELMDLLEQIKSDPSIHWPGWSIDWEDTGVGSGISELDFNRRLAVLFPPFNILIRYVAEGSKWVPGKTPSDAVIPGAATLIKGIEFINEGEVTSISDSVTEATYSWCARDIKTLSSQQFQAVISNSVVPDVLGPADQLKSLILDGQRIREQTFKADSNSLFGTSTPFSSIA